MPLFSIIIPTYQSGSTVAACIASVLNQTLQDFEIIVQDGQSSDETIEAVKRYQDSRIRLFSEKDSGVYDAMNRAIDKLSGEWVLFLGSDDRLYANDTLRKLKDVVSSTPADLVYGNVLMSGDSRWIKDGDIYMGETNLAVLFEKNLCHQSILYHRRIFDNGERYNTRYTVLADFDFNLRCFARYDVQYTPLIISVFATGGISSTMVDEAFAHERWENIANYYGYKLLSPSLIGYERIFKRTGKRLLKRGKLREGTAALTAYLYFKFLKLVGRRRD